MLNEGQLKKLMDDDEYDKFIKELNPKDLMVKETLREAVLDMGAKKDSGETAGGSKGEAKEGAKTHEASPKESEQSVPKPKDDQARHN